MNRYWIVPAAAVCAIVTSMVYALASIEQPVWVAGKAIFSNGLSITDLRFESSHAQDEHKVALLKLNPGNATNVALAVHLNDKHQQIMVNVGDFPLARFCTGGPELTCEIPLPLQDFKQADTIGIAAYSTPGALFEISQGRSDWGAHRALFNTSADNR